MEKELARPAFTQLSLSKKKEMTEDRRQQGEWRLPSIPFDRSLCDTALSIESEILMDDRYDRAMAAVRDPAKKLLHLNWYRPNCALQLMAGSAQENEEVYFGVAVQNVEPDGTGITYLVLQSTLQEARWVRPDGLTRLEVWLAEVTKMPRVPKRRLRRASAFEAPLGTMPAAPTEPFEATLERLRSSVPGQGMTQGTQGGSVLVSSGMLNSAIDVVGATYQNLINGV